MNIKKVLQTSLFKTVYFNIKYFGIRGGAKLPVLISRNVKFKHLKGSVKSPLKIGIVSLGYGQSSKKFIFENEGSIIFEGKTNIGAGCKISNKGILSFGDKFAMHRDSDLICYENIKFGENCLVSWECQFLDTDFHKILTDGIIYNFNKKICIGNHVWIGCRSTILKGVSLSDNTIVAACSTLSKSCSETGCIISDNNILKKNVDWKY